MSAARHKDEARQKLDELLYILHQPGSYIISRRLETALGIDADNGFRIRTAQMDPVIIELYLQPVIGVDGMILVFHFYLLQHGRHIDTRP